MSKKIISVIVFLIGVALIVIPFAMGMFDKTSAGADLMKDFSDNHVMEQPTVDQFNADYAVIEGMQADMNDKMMPWLAETLQKSPEELNGLLGQNFPALAKGIDQLNPIKGRLRGVIDIMGRNIENFASANELPMRATPWFFVIPGALLVILAGLQLAIRDKKKVVEKAA